MGGSIFTIGGIATFSIWHVIKHSKLLSGYTFGGLFALMLTWGWGL
jgi:hypothetical protein